VISLSEQLGLLTVRTICTIRTLDGTRRQLVPLNEKATGTPVHADRTKRDADRHQRKAGRRTRRATVLTRKVTAGRTRLATIHDRGSERLPPLGRCVSRTDSRLHRVVEKRSDLADDLGIGRRNRRPFRGRS
jgi:hypothetical protein